MPQQTNKQNSFLLSGNREDGPMVIGRYTQTRQKWLKARIVKSSHGRHYKEALAVYRNDNTTTTISNTVLKT